MSVPISTSTVGSILEGLRQLGIREDSKARVLAIAPDNEEFVVTNISQDDDVTLNYSAEDQQAMSAGALVSGLMALKGERRTMLWGPDAIGCRDGVASISAARGKVFLALP